MATFGHGGVLMSDTETFAYDQIGGDGGIFSGLLEFFSLSARSVTRPLSKCMTQIASFAIEFWVMFSV